MSTARKHHYVPKSYLSAWTDDGTVDGQLQVIDKLTGRAWSVRPVNAAKETDLYTIDVSEVEADVHALQIERMFSIIEDAAAPVIRRMLNGEGVVTDAQRESVMSLLATLVARMPSRLDWIEQLLRKPVEMAYQKLEAEGKLPQPSDPALAAQMKEWREKGLIRFTIKQNARLAMMASMLPTLLKLFMLRRWTVLRTQADAGDLICTDHPVLLEWIKQVPPGTSPGFGLQNTAVFVPIGPTAALLGLWDAGQKDVTLTREQVTFWNGELLGHVDRFVFSRGDFAALHRSGSIHWREDVIRCWANPR